MFLTLELLKTCVLICFVLIKNVYCNWEQHEKFIKNTDPRLNSYFFSERLKFPFLLAEIMKKY